MLKKLSAISCLGLATLGLVSLPAQADDARIQNSTQQTYIDGSGNNSTQINRQINKTRHSGRGRRNSDSGYVQDTYQDNVVVGDDNDSRQYSEQRNVVETGRRRKGKKRGGNHIEMNSGD